jgi:hypothetical protein
MQIRVVASAYFSNVCVVFAQILILTVQLYIIQLFVSLFPRGTHTKDNWKRYRNIQIVIFERECVIVVCL